MKDDIAITKDDAEVLRIERAAAALLLPALRAAGYYSALAESRRTVLYSSMQGQTRAPLGVVAARRYSPLPEVWRLHVDDLSVSATRAEIVAIGMVPDDDARPGSTSFLAPFRPFQPARGERLELTCLPSELGELARWLPSWIAARDAGPKPGPMAPFPLVGANPPDRYEWTRAASDAYTPPSTRRADLLQGRPASSPPPSASSGSTRASSSTAPSETGGAR
jgi:hypothetical protein